MVHVPYRYSRTYRSIVGKVGPTVCIRRSAQQRTAVDPTVDLLGTAVLCTRTRRHSSACAATASPCTRHTQCTSSTGTSVRYGSMAEYEYCWYRTAVQLYTDLLDVVCAHCQQTWEPPATDAQGDGHDTAVNSGEYAQHFDPVSTRHLRYLRPHHRPLADIISSLVNSLKTRSAGAFGAASPLVHGAQAVSDDPDTTASTYLHCRLQRLFGAAAVTTATNA